MRKDLKPSRIAKLLPRAEREASIRMASDGTIHSQTNYLCTARTPVMWTDVPFPNYKVAAATLDVSNQRISTAWRKYGCLDQIPPGKNSVYYSKNDQEDKHHFITKVLAQYGVKAVARAYRIEYSNFRKKRDRGTLWTLAWWPRIDAQSGHPKLTTEKALVERINKPPRRPYVYVVVWSKSRKKYIGSRTADYCTPDDLMKSYFSSSPNVMEHIYQHGLPDEHYIFECADVMDALHTESFLLKQVGASPDSIKEQYLNKIYHFRNSPYSAIPPYIARNVDNYSSRQRKGLIEA